MKFVDAVDRCFRKEDIKQKLIFLHKSAYFPGKYTFSRITLVVICKTCITVKYIDISKWKTYWDGLICQVAFVIQFK